MRQPIISAVFLLLFSIPSFSKALYFAQVADGGGYTTTFTILNPDTNASIGTLELTDSYGNPWSITLADGRTGSRFSFVVPGMGSARLASAGQGPLKTGWALLTSGTTLLGVEAFDFRLDSKLMDSVSVIGIPSGKHFSIPLETSSVTDLGLAVTNVGAVNANLRLALKPENGITGGAMMDARLNPLVTKQHLAIYASELFPNLRSNTFKGSLDIEVVGPGDIAVVGLSYKEGQLSSVPVAALSRSFSTSKEKAERLLGAWTFNFTIIDSFTNTYMLSRAEEDPLEPGMWYAVGTDQYGDRVAAGWIVDLGYVLVDPNYVFTTHFDFDFTGPNSVSGLYYQYNNDGTVSRGYPMTGTRTSGPATQITSRSTTIQPQLEREKRELSQAQLLEATDPMPSSK